MTPVRGLKYLLASSLALAITGFTAGSLAAPPAQAPSQLTPQDCAVCHEDLVKAFAGNPHEVLEKSPHYNVLNPCESCHGPGQAHIEGGGDITKIISFEGKDFKTYTGQCLACHRDSRHINDYTASRHAKQGLDCADCHKIHNSALTTPLLKERTSALCMSCHTLQRTEFSKPFHHRVKEMAMSCTDCHQPHSGLDTRMVRNSFSGQEICFRCHTEKQGPFVFEHPAINVSGCMGCHQPHGSNNSKMLVRPTVRSLCLECHSASTNVLTAQPPSFHNLNSPIFQNCTTCHVMIHGSNFSRLFLR